MTIAQALPSHSATAPRWLLLGSLALNLFFCGVAVALLIRGPGSPPPVDRSISGRIERIADTLPKADGDLLRAEFGANRSAVDAARKAHDAARNGIRAVLRREPFDAEAMRTAMAQTRAARQNLESVLQPVFVAAAAKMTTAGRAALADWPPGQRIEKSGQ
jgi:uncharacterized membrane protein